MMYIYSLYDARTGELVHEGTPGELVAAGVYRERDEASRSWTRQHLKGAVPAKWRIERRQKMPQKKRDPDKKPGVQTRQIWEYSLYDAQVKLICRGTAAELVEAGYFGRDEDVANAFYAGQSRRLGVCNIGRRKVWREISCRPKGPLPGGAAAKTAKSKRLPGGACCWKHRCSGMCTTCANTTPRRGRWGKKS